MKLDIASHAYVFRIVSGPILQGGKRYGSLCDHGPRREILVSSTVPPQVRPEIAALAVSEAWRHLSITRPPIPFVGDVD